MIGEARVGLMNLSSSVRLLVLKFFSVHLKV